MKIFRIRRAVSLRSNNPASGLATGICVALACMLFAVSCRAQSEPKRDYVRDIQFQAVETGVADWGHWGSQPDKFSQWTNHSNRLIPVYVFGMSLDSVKDEKSIYRDEASLKKLYGHVPQETLDKQADHFDQTQIYQLQKEAIAAGKKHVFLVVFDGMDWQTTQAAAIYKTQKVAYDSGRGTGLHFQDYRGAETDFGWMVTSPHDGSTKFDVDAQALSTPGEPTGGYCCKYGGVAPWGTIEAHDYLLGKYRNCGHVVTDSAASATSMTSGIKTYNGSINIAPDGSQVEPIARWLQREKNFSIGVVTSVPISHATPASAYSNNVTRNDYQDLSRDLLGIPSVAHRDGDLVGVDVLLGGGFGIDKEEEANQGANFVPGNRYLPEDELDALRTKNGGKYVVALRTRGKRGADVLNESATAAVEGNHRLFGFFGGTAGHLPFQTADGNYDPTRGVSSAERYKKSDVTENPTLAEMTSAALQVLEKDKDGFWLMVESGDVDWANHNNNIDDSIGAVFSGDAAIKTITDWVEANDAWDDSALIVTADHGHYFVLTQPEILLEKSHQGEAATSATKKQQSE